MDKNDIKFGVGVIAAIIVAYLLNGPRYQVAATATDSFFVAYRVNTLTGTVSVCAPRGTCRELED